MNHSTPGLPVHHQLLEFTQTHVHWVGDAIQPSHPLLSPPPPAPNPSYHQGLFQWVNSSYHWYSKWLSHSWNNIYHNCYCFAWLVQFSSVAQPCLNATPWTVACQASLSITNSWSPPKLMSIKSVMPSNHLILCRPLLLLPLIFPSIRIFSNESALRIRWSKY